MPNPKDAYGSYGSVPDISSGGETIGQRQTNRASPDDFGAQVGRAKEYLGGQISKVGEEGLALATKYAQQDTEARVNNSYATQFVPAAAELRSKFDQLEGQDKVAGYEAYVRDLNALGTSFSSQFKGYGQQLAGKLATSRLADETDSAKRTLAESLKEFNTQSTYEKMKADAGFAVQNYNNPAIVDSIVKSNDATVALQHIDNGYNPDDPFQAQIIEQSQKAVRGSMASEMINKAVQDGNLQNAVEIRQKFSNSIPGPQQLLLDDVIHRESMRNMAVNGTTALKSGEPLPQNPAMPPAAVQAVVADTAKAHGVDPNHALTVALIESSMGQNLGTRGDIGQTGRRGNLNEQATNMVVEMKKAEDAARKALGREPDAWETYLCYQQGIGGGPAILKALEAAPNAKAVEVLRPLYKDPKSAYQAVANNGGNATMTSSDFANFIKTKYLANAARANCDFSQTDFSVATSSPGDAILKPHMEQGNVVQPGATPKQELVNFEARYGELAARIEQVPNLATRKNLYEALDEDLNRHQKNAKVYSDTLVYKAQQLMVDQDFTSMEQVPSDLYAELASERPDMLVAMEHRAESNLNHNSTLPLDFNTPETLPMQLISRFGDMKPGTPASKVLREKDSAALAETWNGMKVDQRLAFLNQLSQYAQTPQQYQMAVQAVRPDSPVTAMAGDFLKISRQLPEQNHWFAADQPAIKAQDVAVKILKGEELINPSKPDKSTGGIGKPFPMPPDGTEEDQKGLRQFFAENVGDAVGPNPEYAASIYQAYRAYYAAEAADRGDYSGVAKPDIARTAVRAVISNVVNVNDKNVIPPWGMEEDVFVDKAANEFNSQITANGFNPKTVRWQDVNLIMYGTPGRYAIKSGSGFLLDRNGSPVILNIKD